MAYKRNDDLVEQIIGTYLEQIRMFYVNSPTSSAISQNSIKWDTTRYVYELQNYGLIFEKYLLISSWSKHKLCGIWDVRQVNGTACRFDRLCNPFRRPINTSMAWFKEPEVQTNYSLPWFTLCMLNFQSLDRRSSTGKWISIGISSLTITSERFLHRSWTGGTYIRTDGASSYGNRNWLRFIHFLRFIQYFAQQVLQHVFVNSLWTAVVADIVDGWFKIALQYRKNAINDMILKTRKDTITLASKNDRLVFIITDSKGLQV